MARRVTTYVGDTPTDPELRPKHLTKQEFARRLGRLRLEKSWSQSELARQANVSRDSVSTYITGKSLPDPVNLERLAKALGVTTTELLPNHMEAAIDYDEPSLEMKVSGGNGSIAWLRVNRAVSTTTASEIVKLLGADVVPDRT